MAIFAAVEEVIAAVLAAAEQRDVLHAAAGAGSA